MDLDFSQLPAWTWPLIWTALTLIGGYLLGHVINVLILPRVARLVRRTRGDWDDIVLGELKRRMPFWALLIAVWLSLGHWVLRADVRGLAEQVLTGLAGISITLAISAIVSRMVVAYHTRATPDVPVTRLTQNVVRIAILIVGGLMIANALGLNITAALTALGVGGLAVALALQDPLSNLFAGLFTSVAGQVRIGDYVQLDSGQEGHVVDMDWRSTRLRMLSGVTVLVPNAKLSQSIVTSYGLDVEDWGLSVQVGVDYGSDLAHVERVAIDVARSVMQDVEGGVPTHDPAVRYHTFADSSINFSVNLRGKTFADQFLVKHECIKRLHVRFAQEGINIPYPIRTLTTREPLSVRTSGPGATPEGDRA